MANQPPPQAAAAQAPRGLSLAGGYLALRGVRAFLARGRAAAARRAAPPPKRRHRPSMPPPGKLCPKTVDVLKKSTHFNKLEIEALHLMFRELVNAAPAPSPRDAPPARHETMDQNTFRDVMHNIFALVTEETLLERLWLAWDRGGSGGGGSGNSAAGSGASEGALRFEAWVRGLSVLLKGTSEERLRHCFSVYDLNADGYITRDEMFLLLKNSLLKQPGDEDPDEGVRELVELVLKKLDADKDGRVSMDDYKQAVEEEPLLLEAFGQCMPTRQHAAAFLRTLQAR